MNSNVVSAGQIYNADSGNSGEDPLPPETRQSLTDSKNAAKTYGIASCLLCFSGFCPCFCYHPIYICCCMPCCYCTVWPAAGFFGNLWQTASRLGEPQGLFRNNSGGPTQPPPVDQVSLNELKRAQSRHAMAVKSTLCCSICVTVWGMVWSILWFLGGLRFQGGIPYSIVKVDAATFSVSTMGGPVVAASTTKLSGSNGIQEKMPSSSSGGSDIKNRPFLIPSTTSTDSVLTSVTYHETSFIHYFGGDMTPGWLTVAESAKISSLGSSNGCFVVPYLEESAPVTIDNCDQTNGIGGIAKEYGDVAWKEHTFWGWLGDAEKPDRGILFIPHKEDSYGMDKNDWHISLCSASTSNQDGAGSFGVANSYFCIKKKGESGDEPGIEFLFSKELEQSINIIPLFVALLTIIFFWMIMCLFNKLMYDEHQRNFRVDGGLAQAQMKLSERANNGNNMMMMNGMGGMAGMQPMMVPMGGVAGMQPMTMTDQYGQPMQPMGMQPIAGMPVQGQIMVGQPIMAQGQMEVKG